MHAATIFRRRRRRRQLFTLSFATVAFLLLSPFSVLGSDPSPDFKVVEGEAVSRRRLGGLGSSPPACSCKCGTCTPCKAVHIPIKPGLSVPLEYYPEAWRCECGSKIFMP